MKTFDIFNLKLSHKGLILVCVPLLFELIVFVTLAVLLQQAEVAARQAQHSKVLISQANSLIQDVYQGGVVLSGYLMSGGGPVFKRRYEQITETIPRELDAFEKLVGNEPAEQEHLRRASILGRQTMGLLVELKRYADESGSNALMWRLNPEVAESRLGRIRERFEPMISQLTSELSSTIEKHKEIEAASEEAAARSRGLAQGCLFACVVLNIALALGLAVFFNKGTSKRLAVVTDNTLRLGKGEELNPELSGDDEIARVDRTFHEMANALADAARRERAVVEYAVDVICSIDSSGKFAAVSPAALKLWQYSPSELTGTQLRGILVPDDIQRTEKEIEEIKTGSLSGAFENRVKRKDGTEIEMLWSVYWSDKEQSLFCVAHDDSERKELDRRKQDFFRMISHDLRSPLTSLLVFLTGVGDGKFDQRLEKLKEKGKLASQSAEKMIDLVSAILDIEKMQSGEMKLVFDYAPLDSIVKRSVESLRDLAEKQGVTLESPSSNLEVYVDEDYLGQVVTNLISNSIKFSPPESTVTVQASELEDCVVVEVIDRGRGIPAEAQKSVFEKFKQVSREDGRQKRGTGLGLPICKAIIEAHGGSIGVESDGANGSKFWFRIPKAKSPAFEPTTVS